MKREKLYRTFLWTCVVLLIITILIATGRRFVDLADTRKSGILLQPDSIEYGYAKNPALTLLHILPGIIFLLLGALQFSKAIRRKYIHLHRWSGRINSVLGIVIGVSAIIMSFTIRFGGYIETSAVVLFGAFFLFSLARAYMHIRKKEFSLHREWMIRAYSIGLGIATMRPIIGLFFAFSSLPFSAFFGYTFWIAFILHLSIAELWIRYTRRSELLS